MSGGDEASKFSSKSMNETIYAFHTPFVATFSELYNGQCCSRNA